MRIAVSGAHGTGKSTLVEALADALPDYSTVEEPYYLLLEDGYDFAEVPCLDDFAVQLQRSIESLSEPQGNVIFDRCPADFLAYLLALGDVESFDPNHLMPPAKAAIETLDLIVLVPIESPDRISLPSDENRRLRKRVDQKLQELLLDNDLAVDIEVLLVTGTVPNRIEILMQRIR